MRRKIYNVYKMIKERCYNKNRKDYKYYGYKGIKMCTEWNDNFETFYEWAILNGYKKGMSIDRINSNGDYEPTNCRIIKLSENCRFKSSTNYITVNEITKSGRQWAIYLNRSVNYINKMIKSKGIEYTKKYIKNNIV